MAYLQLLRPQQWSKNVFLFAGLVFGQKIGEPDAVGRVLAAFVCFCLLSSAVYVVNDIHDREEDRLHPRKSKRPIASGRVSVGAAGLVALSLLLFGLCGAFALNRPFLMTAAAYVALQAAYTFALKHQVLVDVIVLGLGFVLRAIAGAVVIPVEISPWLVLCTFTLCLFMGFSKRRCELSALENGGDAARHRKTLGLYTRDLLNHFTTLTAGIAVVSFMLYATDERTIGVFKTNYLLYSLPLVVYCIFRFAFLVEHGLVDGPTEVLLKDRPFQFALLLWGGCVLAIVYRGPQIQAWLTHVPA